MSDEAIKTRWWAWLVFRAGLAFDSMRLRKFGLKYMPYTGDMGRFEKLDWTRNKLAISKEQ